jgi:stage II sporulation protein D
VSEYSATGNVLELKFTYTNGTTNTFTTRSSSWLRNKLGCRSLHFTVAGSGQEMPQGLAVNDGTGTMIEQFNGLYVTAADGTVLLLQEEIPYVITGAGEVLATSKPSVIPKGTFVITGTGWGHNIGYSQWGGYAMALQGYTYDEILKFYYTGIEVGPKS